MNLDTNIPDRLATVFAFFPETPAQERRMISAVLAGGPSAQVAAKELILEVSGRPLDDDLVELTAERIAQLRTSDEAQEGIAAFLEKRKPRWVKS